jgi:hypothetical protein
MSWMAGNLQSTSAFIICTDGLSFRPSICDLGSACCIENGQCPDGYLSSRKNANGSISYTYCYVDGPSCSPAVQHLPIECYVPVACCCFSPPHERNTCSVQFAQVCQDAGCIYFPGFLTCDNNPCRFPEESTGACCHCDWCCENLDAAACTAAGGTFRSGQPCPASGPCTPNAPCPPCKLQPFQLVRNSIGDFASPGYQPASITAIKAIDDSGADTPRVMYANVSARDNESHYVARSCNIYNRRLPAPSSNRQAVSDCALSATSLPGGGSAYQFVCPYREPCAEKPSVCTR